MNKPAVGLIFDFDGTIVISEPLHMRAWVMVGDELGRPVPEEILEKGVGATDEDVAQDLARIWGPTIDYGVILRRKCAIYESLAGEAPFVDGFAPLLAKIKERGIPVGIATSAHRTDIAPVLDGRGYQQYFDAIATVEDVKNPKPDPEIYLKVAAKLGVAPERCIGFEDSPAGAQAVRAAGMRVVGMTTTFPRERLGDLTLAMPDYPDAESLFAKLEIT